MRSHIYNDYKPSEEVNELRLTLIIDSDPAAQGSTYLLPLPHLPTFATTVINLLS